MDSQCAHLRSVEYFNLSQRILSRGRAVRHGTCRLWRGVAQTRFSLS
jgi:hypothetical protein